MKFVAILLLIFSNITFAQTQNIKLIKRYRALKSIDTLSATKKLVLKEIYWGMAKDSLLNFKKSKPIFQNKNEIDYTSNFLNRKSYIAYKFLDNKLISYSYVFEKKYLSSDIFELYSKLSYLLTKSYAKPFYTDTIFAADTKKYYIGETGKIQSILLFWNLKNSITYLRYINLGKFPLIVKFSDKNYFNYKELKN